MGAVLAKQHRRAPSGREPDGRSGAEVAVSDPEVARRRDLERAGKEAALARVAVLAWHQINHQAGVGVKDDERMAG